MASAKAVSFLAKKSWHTGTMKHMEKVWKAEEQRKVEEKKLKEWKKEHDEERDIEELRKNYEQSSGLPRSEKVDFIYQTPLAASEPSTEDYLTGTRYRDRKDDNDVSKIQQKPGSLWLNEPLDVMQDKRAKIREDPLFSIRKEEQAAKARFRDNPIQMKKLREEVLRKKLREELKKDKGKKRSRDHDDRPLKRVKTEHENKYYSRASSRSSTSKDRSSSKKKKSKEELERRRQELLNNAQEVDKYREDRIKKYTEEEEKERKEHSQKDKGLGPQFINDMGKKVYSDSTTASVEDRLNRGRFYIQKTQLDEKGMLK